MSHDFTGSGDTFTSVSYVTPASQYVGSLTTAVDPQWQMLRQFSLPSQGGIQGALGGLLGAAAAITPPPTQKEEHPMARLIRYTVVNPNPHLAKQKPELSILTSGTVMLDGVDDKGFLMDLAPRVAELLPAHNQALGDLRWEDPEGKERPFKPVKLSNLDVVIEALKSYA